jgi:hypothetical protein
MRLFGEIQDYEGPLSPEHLVANPKTQERLAAVLAAIPGHLSAKLLLDHGTGKTPERLSLRGSVREIDARMKRVMEVANPEGVAVLPAEQDKVCADSLILLRRMRPKMATEASGYCDAATDLIEMMREYLELTNPASNAARVQAQAIGAARARVDEEREKLRAVLE